MVALPQAVDVAKQAGQGGNSVMIPQGQYQAIIVGSEAKPTNGGSGQMIVFKIVITHGEYANTEFSENTNIVNASHKAVEIAYQTIANMGKAVGLTNISDSSELHNKPLMVEVKTVTPNDWVNDKGETVKGKERSEIKKYLPLPAGGVALVAAPVAPVQQEAPAAPAANPFAA